MLNVQPGNKLKRNQTLGPDSTDVAFDLIRGATFQVLRVNKGVNIDVEVVDSQSSYPAIGSKMGIPEKYLESRYFSVLR